MRTGGTWETGSIDETGDVGRHPSLAVGTDSLARISYHDVSEHALRLTTEDGTSGAPDGESEDWVLGELAARGAVIRTLPHPVGPEGARIRWERLPSAATGTDSNWTGDLHLDLFDTTGRRIRQLDLGAPDAQSGEAYWDGCDDGGGPLAVGSGTMDRRSSCRIDLLAKPG